jgi:Ni/Fe-hydrogenase subunit HybB-like protein
MFFLALRMLDLIKRDALPLLLDPRPETWLFMLEVCLFLLPMLLLFRGHIRNHPDALYGSAVMVILGFVTHRLNVSITGMEAAAGVSYVPKWTEITVTAAIVALGFAIFRLAAEHLPVFEDSEEHHSEESLVEAEIGAHRALEGTHV